MRSHLAAGKGISIAALAACAACGEPPLGESAAAVSSVPIALSLIIDCRNGSGTLGTIVVVRGTAEYLDPFDTRVSFATTPAIAGQVICTAGTKVKVPLTPIRLPTGSPIITLEPLGTSACDPSPLAELFASPIAVCSLSTTDPTCAVPAVPLACVRF